MGWKITFETAEGERSVNLDDLSPETFDKLAEDDPEGNWWSVYNFPGGNYGRMYKVIRACAAHLGIDPPAPASTMADSQRLIEMLSREQDIAKQPMADGFPQVPDETESGSSSTSSGDTTGDPQTSDESPSETS